MKTEKIVGEVFANSEEECTNSWLYLPMEKPWSLDSKCLVLESEEVPPEEEDKPNAGIPQIAISMGMIQIMPITTVQDIIINAKEQSKTLSEKDFFEAFLYYYDNDAFMAF